MGNVLFSIMDEAVQALDQTNAFTELKAKDPFMIEASDHLSRLLEKAKGIDTKLWDKIDEVTGLLMAACEDCGFLYGLQVAEAFRRVSENPVDFTRHIYKRVYGGVKA